MIKNRHIAAVIVGVFLFAGFDPVWAGAILDGTFNPATAGLELTGDFEIKAAYGKTEGQNLFHSFKTFGINTGESATFTGPNTVQNIIARVTGGQTSLIDGILRSQIDGADIYLLNPAGILFGENAQLDTTGSFHAGSADYLIMKDDVHFSSHSDSPVLSVADPVGFGFVDDAFGFVQVLSSKNLEVGLGKTISLVGGEIKIQKGTITAMEGRVNLVSLSSADEVILTQTGIEDIDNANKGGITISDDSWISVSGGASGDIFIVGSQFLLNNDSVLEARTDGGKTGGKTLVDVESFNAQSGSQIVSENIFYKDDGLSTPSRGGDIIIKASGSVTFSDSSQLTCLATVDQGYDTDCVAGDISIEAKHVSFKGGSQIETRSIHAGKGGDVDLKATGDIAFIDSLISSETDSGDAGDISIQAKNISFFNNAGPASQTSGNGKGGTIFLKAADTLTIQGTDDMGYAASITSYSRGDNSGDAGDINIEAKSIILKEGAQIIASTMGRGDGGKINIKTNGGTVTLIGTNPHGENIDGFASGIASRSEMDDAAAGKAGDIEIEADLLTITRGGQINNTTRGGGDSGSIQIACDEVQIEGMPTPVDPGDFLESQVDFHKTNTGSQLLPSGIYSRSETQGDYSLPGGQIAITASDIRLSDNGSLSSASTGGRNAGNIKIETRTLELTSGATISSASTRAQKGGAAGKIQIEASDSIRLADHAALTTEAVNTAAKNTAGKDNGKIMIHAASKIYMTDSQITTSVQGGTGNGGDIEIDPIFVILDKSRIIANAFQGNGGNIHIVANWFIQSNDSLVDASSLLGIDGIINIEAPDVDVSQDLVTLPTNFFDAAKWLRTPCAQQTDEDQSRFVVLDQLPVSLDIDNWQPCASEAADAESIQ